MPDHPVHRISKEGKELLADPIMFDIITAEAISVGVTAEEYLIRFEQILSTTPDLIFKLFEQNRLKV
jgi:hypothetical protein